MLDSSMDYKIQIDNEEPYDREFKNPQTYIPYAMRTDVLQQYQGPIAILQVTTDLIVPNKPKRD